MVDLNDQGLRRQNALNDITETTGLVFLGLTIGCARCHDHKFDPIRQADFYRLQAFFTPARFRDDYPIASTRRAGRRTRRGSRAWEAEVAALQAGVDPARGAGPRRAGPRAPAGLDDEAIAAFQTARGRADAGRGPRSSSRRWPRTAGSSPRLWPLVLDPDRDGDPDGAASPGSTRLQKAAALPCPARGASTRRRPEAPPTYLLRRGDFAANGPRGRAGVPGRPRAGRGRRGPDGRRPSTVHRPPRGAWPTG